MIRKDMRKEFQNPNLLQIIYNNITSFYFNNVYL